MARRRSTPPPTVPHRVLRSERRRGYTYVMVEFWRSPADQAAGRAPFLLNDFKLYHAPAGQLAATAAGHCPAGSVAATEIAAYYARALARGWTGDRRGTTTIYQVAAGGDDGTVTGGDVLDDTAGNLTVGNDGAVYHAWYRFTGVAGLGAGVTVNSAILSVHGFAGDTNSPLTNLYFDPAAAPTNPSSLANYQARLTGSYVGWSPPNLTTGLWSDSPELATILQEVVDAVGGSGPSALLVLHPDGASGGGDFANPYAYDGSAALAAKLTIDTSGGVSPLPPVHRHPRPIYGR